MHDTDQLRTCCLSDEDIRDTFLDVFAADKIPPTLPEEFFLIANTDASHLPGTHWIVLAKKKNNRAYFFDSYGLSPMHYNANEWARFGEYRRSQRNLQQFTSDVCGDYCLYFCKCFSRLRRNTPEIIFRHFDEHDTRANDETVFEVVHSEYPRTLNSTPHRLGKKDVQSFSNYPFSKDKLCNQGCRSRKDK